MINNGSEYRTQVLNAIMCTISVMGNRGTFTKPWRYIIVDFEFLYHMGYLTVSLLGLFMHEFFYSLLVGALREFEIVKCLRLILK